MSIRMYRQFVTKMKFPISTIPSYVLLSKLYVQLGMIVAIILIFMFIWFLSRYLLFAVFILYSNDVNLLYCVIMDIIIFGGY